MEALLPLVLLLPLFGALLVGLTGFWTPGFRKNEGLLGILATAAVGVPFFILLALFLQLGEEAATISLGTWFTAGDFSVSYGFSFDQLSVLMGLVVTGVGALIHVYSIGYMHGDAGFYKYFAYLNLFVFAMLNLILSDNLVGTFLGWEGVGAMSYLLIGFWYTDMAKAKAAQKAFVANRIGDFAFLIAIFIAVATAGTVSYTELLNAGSFLNNPAVLTAFAALVFVAATGKSAQIPLYVWLPDAMAGPTPVSALIHAATMVTSGVYLIARLSYVFAYELQLSIVIAFVGAATALLAAIIAISQNDIKKVLAYSTVSQLGFMFMALGADAYSTAIFHVVTHAFFKACLFLGSGSVIHAMEHTGAVEDPQDIRTMGGLGKFLPSTARTFWISTLAIAGIPLFSGFFSKDEILAKTFAFGTADVLGGEFYLYVWGIGIVTAFLTAVYMTRLSTLVFRGQPRFDAASHPPHESPAVMTLPLWVLAALAIVGGFIGLPEVLGHLNWITPYLETRVQNIHLHLDHATEWALIGLSSAIAVLGVGFAYSYWGKQNVAADARLAKALGPVYRASRRKFWVDEFYNAVLIRPFVWLSTAVLDFFDRFFVDGLSLVGAGLVGLLGSALRQLQTGVAQAYALLVLTGTVAMLAYLVFG